MRRTQSREAHTLQSLPPTTGASDASRIRPDERFISVLHLTHHLLRPFHACDCRALGLRVPQFSHSCQSLDISAAIQSATVTALLLPSQDKSYVAHFQAPITSFDRELAWEPAGWRVRDYQLPGHLKE